MMNKKQFLIYLVMVFCSSHMMAQSLKPGFDKVEYRDLMKISAQFGDTEYASKFIVPEKYRKDYRSEEIGLVNMWELWTDEKGTVIVSLRGTTEQSESWLANFYAAMVPAKGELKFAKNEIFKYELASNPKAAVHVGWLVSTAFIFKDMQPKLDAAFAAGSRDMLIIGHSQGGAIAYLLMAHLLNLQEKGLLPEDLAIKTYCSAAPKPGNLYFAYDYESKTQSGWAFNVVNSADWVPEVPVSIQTLDDFNDDNPFSNAEQMIKNERLASRVVMSYAFKKLYKPTKKAQQNYQKMLGDITSKSVRKLIEGFEPPEYYESNDYVRVGRTIVLYADEDYYENNPSAELGVFKHHFHNSYLYLLDKLNFEVATGYHKDTLDGEWELTHMDGYDISKAEQIPYIRISGNKINGDSGCNTFTGPMETGNKLFNVGEQMVITKMLCPGEIENIFIKHLQNASSYQIRQNKMLSLYRGDKAILRFIRVN